MDRLVSVLLFLTVVQIIQGTYYYKRPVRYLRHNHHHHHRHIHQPTTVWYNQPLRVYYTTSYTPHWTKYTRPYPGTGMNIPSQIFVNRNTHHPTTVIETNTVWPSETVDPSVSTNDLWKDLGIDKNKVITDTTGGKVTGFPVIPGADGPLPDSPNVFPDFPDVLPDSTDSLPDPTITLPDSTNVLPDSTDVLPDISPIIPDAGFPNPGTDTVITDLPVLPNQGVIDPNVVVPDQGAVDPITGSSDDGIDSNTLEPVIPILPVVPDGPVQNDTQVPTCHITGCPSGHECVFADNWICPIYIKEIPCGCRLGCRLDYNFIPFGKEMEIDDCGNVCKCNNIYGAAECTQRMCNPDTNSTSIDSNGVTQTDNSIDPNEKINPAIDIPVPIDTNPSADGSPDFMFPNLPSLPNIPGNVVTEEALLQGNPEPQNVKVPKTEKSDQIIISRNIIVPSNNLLAKRLKSEGQTF